jgi:hypothetical protein
LQIKITLISLTSSNRDGADMQTFRTVPQRTYPPQDVFVETAMAGEVVVQIGQIAPSTVKQLDKLVRAGTLLKWRGKWFPVAGAAFGLGPDKTCWGLAEKFGAAS